jgi:hypothetical protein
VRRRIVLFFGRGTLQRSSNVTFTNSTVRIRNGLRESVVPHLVICSVEYMRVEIVRVVTAVTIAFLGET